MRSSDHLAAVSSKPRFDVVLFMPCGYYASAKLLRAGDDLAEISRPVGKIVLLDFAALIRLPFIQGHYTMFRKLYDRLASLTFGLWLIGGVCLLLALGSFGGGGAEGSSINDLPLFQWLAETPLVVSWWLWGAIGVLAILALNTVLCSIESVRMKYRRGNFLVLIAPQVMHAGFLLIVLAHLFSAKGGYKQVMPIQEGGVITCPDGTRLQVGNLAASMGPMGFPTDYSAEVRSMTGGREEVTTISPNHPYFYKGSGFYLKEVVLEPYRAALIEIHREPGAGVALAGALLFTVGNAVLLYVRRGKQFAAAEGGPGGQAPDASTASAPDR